MKKSTLFIMAFLAVLTSCGNIQSRMLDKAKKNITESLDDPKSFKLLAVSEPDSAFGLNYFTEKEMMGMASVAMKVNEILFEKYDSVKKGTLHDLDPYTKSLATRHMDGSVNMLKIGVGMSDKEGKKGDWSGWKLKVDYQATDKDGITYRSERWFFFDRGGNKIEKSFDIVLP